MPAWPLPSVGSWGWSSATFAPLLVMDLCCRPWGNIFVVLSCFIWYITMHFCTDLFFWSFLSQARAQLVQADNLQFGSLGAATGDDAERRWWTTMGGRWRVLTKSLGRVCCRHQSCYFDFTLLIWRLLLSSLPGCCGWKLCWFLFFKDEQEACR